jgi:uncharacterized protein
VSDGALDSPGWALVTGTSSGIGAEFARQLAAAGHRLVLVGRDAAALEAVRDSLPTASGEGVLADERGPAGAEIIVADLTVPEQRAVVADRLRDPARPVDLLVNNAGIGLGRAFLKSSEERLLYQAKLNIDAVLVLTRAVLPLMLERNRGAVINVASIAAFTPASGASYNASKAWVLTFTEGLAMAVHGTNVKVQALCPGLVRTQFHPRAGLDMSQAPSYSWLPVEKVVAQSLADLERGRVISVPGLLYRVMAIVPRLVPRRVMRALALRVESKRFRR